MTPGPVVVPKIRNNRRVDRQRSSFDGLGKNAGSLVSGTDRRPPDLDIPRESHHPNLVYVASLGYFRSPCRHHLPYRRSLSVSATRTAASNGKRFSIALTARASADLELHPESKCDLRVDVAGERSHVAIHHGPRVAASTRARWRATLGEASAADFPRTLRSGAYLDSRVDPNRIYALIERPPGGGVYRSATRAHLGRSRTAPESLDAPVHTDARSESEQWPMSSTSEMKAGSRARRRKNFRKTRRRRTAKTSRTVDHPKTRTT